MLLTDLATDSLCGNVRETLLQKIKWIHRYMTYCSVWSDEDIYTHNYDILKGMGTYGPLLLALVEGLGGSSGPLPSGGN